MHIETILVFIVSMIMKMIVIKVYSSIYHIDRYSPQDLVNISVIMTILSILSYITFSYIKSRYVCVKKQSREDVIESR